MEESGTTEAGHQPVLLEAVVHSLGERSPGYFLDATFGGGGHARALLEQHPGNQLLALDRDPEAEGRADKLGAEYPDRFRFRGWNFARMGELEESGFDGILFDFGIS